MKKTLVLFVLVSVLTHTVTPCSTVFGYANLTAEEEKKLGKEFMFYVKRHLPLIEDPMIHNYVAKVGHRVLSHYPHSPFKIRFYVVNEDVYNAFAGPAGHIFMNSGLLAAMENEDQLAGILGHEIGHVYARHIAKRMEQGKTLNLAVLAGVLAGALLGGSGAAAGAISATSMAMGQTIALQNSRENEIEADQLGLKYFTKAGYNGVALMEMLNKIREKQWFGSQQIPSYLQTHPAVEARLAYLDTWIQVHPEWRAMRKSQGQDEFNKVRTKVIALYSDPESARNTFEASLRQEPTNALALYGKGMLLDREGDSEAALIYLEKAVRQRPFDGDILRDLGKIRYNLGDYQGALKALQGALTINPRDLEGQFLLGQGQRKTNDLDGAIETYETLLGTAPGYLPAVYALGQAHGKQGNLLEAHFNLGMYHKKRGALRNAIFHLSRALELSADAPEKQETIRKELDELPKPKKTATN